MSNYIHIFNMIKYIIVGVLVLLMIIGITFILIGLELKKINKKIDNLESSKKK